jgi:hypothetical protein
MLLLDVNILIYAHRVDVPDHSRYRSWLREIVSTEPTFGMAELVLSGFLRVVTHPKVFRDPSPLDTALDVAIESGLSFAEIRAFDICHY